MGMLGRRELLRRGLRLGAGIGAGAALGAAAALPLVSVAEAGEDMCEGDPVISIDGNRLSIICRIPVRALAYLSPANPVRYTVYLPKKVKAAKQVQYTGPIPEALDFVRTDIQLDQSIFLSAYIGVRIAVPPPPTGVAPYAVYCSAKSEYDFQSGQTVAGRPGLMFIRVPWRS